MCDRIQYMFDKFARNFLKLQCTSLVDSLTDKKYKLKYNFNENNIL